MSVRPPSLASMKALKKPVKVPPGWFTRQELQNEWNLSQKHTCNMINLAMDNGKAEVRKFPLPTRNGIYQTPHYKFK